MAMDPSAMEDEAGGGNADILMGAEPEARSRGSQKADSEVFLLASGFWLLASGFWLLAPQCVIA